MLWCIKLLDQEKERPPPMLERICHNFMLVFASITVVCILVCLCCTCIVYIDDFIKDMVKGKKK